MLDPGTGERAFGEEGDYGHRNNTGTSHDWEGLLWGLGGTSIYGSPSPELLPQTLGSLLVQPEPQGQFPAIRRGPSVLPNILCSSTLEGVDRPGKETMKTGTGMQPAVPRTYANMEWKAQEPTAKAVPRREP